jgi:hypothetical protein
MPHASFKILPGVDQNRTPTLNEAAISDSQFIRFIPDRILGGLVQKLGGWTKYYTNTVGSIIRCLWAWEDTNSNSYLAAGAEGKGPIVVTGASGTGTTVTLTFTGPFAFKVGYAIIVSGISPSGYNGQFTVTASTNNSVSYANTTTTAYVSGGTIKGGGGTLNVITNGGGIDITPQKTIVDIPVKFSTTAGSNEVVVTDTGRNADNYDAIDLQTQVSVGGLVLFGQYQVYNPGGSANTYKIYPTDALGNPANAAFTTLISALTVTGASGTGSIATITYSGSYTFVVGSQVIISGINPSAYNGTYVVTSSTSSSVSFASTTTSAYVSGGTITNNGAVPKFTTTTGSNFVDVTLANHGYAIGDTFTALIATSVGGVTIYGNYIVTSVTSSSVFVIAANNQASSTASGFENAGNAYFIFYNGIGSLPLGSGYGIGPYGDGGYGSGTAPTINSGVPINAIDWTLDNWGQVLVSCPLDGPIYQWDPTSGSPLALLIPEAPPVNDGMFVAMPQRQIVAWGSTFTGVKDPLLIRWCDVENYNSWLATIVNQAGSYRLPKGSKIVQCIQAGQQGLVWTDLGIWAMQYVGLPYVYQFNELGTGCGLIGRKAATSVAGVVYWMGNSQFYRLSGNGVEPIRCPVWDVVFQDLDTNNLDKIRVAPNSRFGEIAWYYPTSSNGGEVSHYIKYNYILDQWDFGELSRTAWINESVLGPPIGAAPNTYIYQHETSTDADGEPMNSYFQTGYFALNEADNKMFVDQVWPDMKWGYYGGTQGANVLLTFYTTDYSGQTPITHGPYTLTQATKFITPRFRGRLVSIKLESNDIGSFWRIGNTRYRFQQDGKY